MVCLFVCMSVCLSLSAHEGGDQKEGSGDPGELCREKERKVTEYRFTYFYNKLITAVLLMACIKSFTRY